MNEIYERQTNEIRTEDKLFNFRPILFTAIALCIGIVAGFYQAVYAVSAWWSCVLIPLVCAPLYFCSSFQRAKRILIAIVCLLLSFLVGLFSFTAKTEEFSGYQNYDGECVVLGTVIEKTDYDEYSRIVLQDINIDGNQEKGTLISYLPTQYNEIVTLCDEVLLRGGIRTDTALTNEYGFRAYAIGEDTRGTLSVQTCTVVGRNFNLFLWIRARMQKVVYAGMDETPASVTLALLTGDTSGIDEGLLENVRHGGIAHIFAVSGLHIGVLYGVAVWIASKTKLSKFPKFLFVAGVLLLYSGICGFSASVIRALVTCLVFYGAHLFAFGSDNLERIGLSAIIVLLLSPTALFEIGFQLSFVACLGIALLARPIQRVFTELVERIKGLFGKRKTKEERENHPLSVMEEVQRACISFFAVTLSAQIATTPLAVNAFGYLSIWSLALNCLFVPLVSVTFSLLIAFVVVACLLPLAISAVVLYLPSTVLSALLLVFQVVEFSALSLESVVIPSGALVCYYGGLTFITDKWNTPRVFKCVFAILFLLFFCGITYYSVA